MYLLIFSASILGFELWTPGVVRKGCRFYFTYGGRSLVFFILALPMLQSFTATPIDGTGFAYGMFKATSLLMILSAVFFFVLWYVSPHHFPVQGFVQRYVAAEINVDADDFEHQNRRTVNYEGPTPLLGDEDDIKASPHFESIAVPSNMSDNLDLNKKAVEKKEESTKPALFDDGLDFASIPTKENRSP